MSDVIDLKAFLAHLSSKQLKCNTCGIFGQGYEILDIPCHLQELAHAVPEGYGSGSRLIPLGVVTCKSCGETRFFNVGRFLKQKQ